MPKTNITESKDIESFVNQYDNINLAMKWEINCCMKINKNLNLI